MSYSLRHASEELKNDKEVVLEEVKKDGLSLEFTSEELKNHKEVVLEAVKQVGDSLQYASEELKNDREVVLEAVKEDEFSLRFVSGELKNDKEVVLEVVKKDGFYLSYASEELKNDKEVVLEAIKQNYSSLQFASEELKNDKEFFRECCLTNRRSIRYIGETLSTDSLLSRKLKKYGSDVERAFEEFEVERNKNIVGEEREFRNEDIFFVNLCYELFKKKWEAKSLEELEGLIEEGERLMEKRKQLKVESRNPLLFEKNRKKYEDKQKFKDRRLGKFLERLDERTKRKYNVPIPSFRGKCFQDIKFFRLVGKGVFGRTYLCKISGISGLFVVKLYQQAIQGLITKEKEEKFLKADCLELPSHPNVVSILFHSKSEKIYLSQLPDFEEYWKPKKNLTNYYIHEGGMLVMKYHHLSLQSLIVKRRIFKISSILNDIIEAFLPIELIILMKGILSGVFHLHKNKIVHRDLHPGNIFVHPGKGRVLIGDYGCSLDLRNNPTGFIVHQDHEILYSVSGSEEFFNKTGGYLTYCSPEIQEFDGAKNDYLDYSKSDLYSCGLIGKELYKLDESKRKSDDSEGLSFLQFLDLLMLDFENRISFEDALERVKEFEIQYGMDVDKEDNETWSELPCD